jgi:hypothetical protein
MSFAMQATAAESTSTTTTGKVGACALLTKDLLEKTTPVDTERFELGLMIPAAEEPVGVAGSTCEYGGVLLQVDPFTSPARIEETLAAKWTRVPGLGDIAYFHDNIGEWAELYVRAGERVITIQMDVPTGRKAESIKPNVIALAEAILPKLK